MTDALRAITITWDAESDDEPEVSLGPGVSVLEAHHVLSAAEDALSFLCPIPVVSRGGVDLGAEMCEHVEDDED